MNIVLHDFSGHPFQVQLSRELAKRGHQITHIYCNDIVGAKGNLQQISSDPCSLRIEGLTIGSDINRYNFVKRLLDERKYGQVVAKRLSELKPDVVICSNTPLDSMFRIRAYCDKTKTPFVFWLQDIIGLAARAVLTTKLGVLGRVIGEYYIAREKRLLRSSQHVIPISTDFLSILASWKIDSKKTTVINNWAPIQEMPPHSKINDWSKKLKSDGCPIAIYSGALGLKHNPKLLLDLAIHLNENHPSARLIVISEGYGADWLRTQNATLNLDSLIQLPFQPFSDLPQVLASADVLLAILEPEAGEFCVPSKVLSYMCVGRPIVLAASEQNLASQLIASNNIGRVVEPTDSNEFSKVVMQMLRDNDMQSEMGGAARAYAELSFDIESIGNKFEAIIKSL